MQLNDVQRKRLDGLAELAAHKGYKDTKGELLQEGGEWILCVSGRRDGKPHELSVSVSNLAIDRGLDMLEMGLRGS